MNLERMLEKLNEQRRNIEFTINYLQCQLDNEDDNRKAKSILNSVKKRRKLHWTQRPENKAKLMKSVRGMLKAKKAK
jgi:hypothetical protein